jgi:hypothetical protein
MRLLLGIVLGLTLCFYKSAAPQAGLASKPVKYYPEGLDTVELDADGTRLKISTRKDYRKLCAAMLQEFGPSLPINNHESQYNDVFYRWKAPQSFGVRGYEMEFIVFKQYQEFIFIQLYITDKKKHWLPIPPEFAAHFKSLCQQYLLVEPTIMQPRRDMDTPHFKYLSAVLAYDSLGLHRSLDSLFDPYNLHARIVFNINQMGEISALKVEAGAKAEVFLRQWIKSLNFPVLIYDTYKDTAIYQVSWQDGLSMSNYLPYMQKLILNHVLPLDSTPYARAFVGDFFKSGDTLAIIPMPDTNLVYAYKIESGVFKALSSNPISGYSEGDEVFFEDMDFDGTNELVFTASPNMHGNIDRTIYTWNQSSGSLELAGSLWGHIELKPEKQEIWESSLGTWYTDQVQTVFGWKAGKLLPKRQIRREPKTRTMENQRYVVKYLVNPFFEKGIDSLVVQFRGTETDRHPRYAQMWEGFFEK